jgi:hypothetical protein
VLAIRAAADSADLAAVAPHGPAALVRVLVPARLWAQRLVPVAALPPLAVPVVRPLVALRVDAPAVLVRRPRSRPSSSAATASSSN